MSRIQIFRLFLHSLVGNYLSAGGNAVSKKCRIFAPQTRPNDYGNERTTNPVPHRRSGPPAAGEAGRTRHGGLRRGRAHRPHRPQRRGQDPAGGPADGEIPFERRPPGVRLPPLGFGLGLRQHPRHRLPRHLRERRRQLLLPAALERPRPGRRAHRAPAAGHGGGRGPPPAPLRPLRAGAAAGHASSSWPRHCSPGPAYW